MISIPTSVERRFFRALNAVVEPAVRRGIGSPRLTPVSLIVLESTGFKSGQTRRTPLWSYAIGPYRIVSTARGDRSLWAKNLKANNLVRYFVGGKPRSARAIVIAPGHNDQLTDSSPTLLKAVVASLLRLRLQGWAFAVLAPHSD